MIKHQFTLREIYYAQWYRYAKLLTIIIALFGLFAIGAAVIPDGAYVMGIMLFIAYFVMAQIAMSIILLVVAFLQYTGTYRSRTFGYQISGEDFIVYVGEDEIYRERFEKLETKVYRRLTYVFAQDEIVAFFPEGIRQDLLK